MRTEAVEQAKECGGGNFDNENYAVEFEAYTGVDAILRGSGGMPPTPHPPPLPPPLRKL